MNTNPALDKFYDTFDTFAEPYRVPAEWQDELEHYFIEGWPPGSFHTALFENNLSRAACCSHPANTWQAIVAFMKWMIQFAPQGSWGDKATVAAWLQQSSEERRRRCEEAGILATAWELLKRKDLA